MNDEIRELRDRLDVIETISRYAHAVDRGDWDAFGALFDDELAFELPHVPTDTPTISREQITRMAHDTTAGFDATHHPITNHVVTLDGDTATCVCYAQAYHTLPTERGVTDYCVVRGFYEFGLRRSDEGWRINRMKVEFHGPVEGYMGVYDLARERLEARTAGAA